MAETNQRAAALAELSTILETDVTPQTVLAETGLWDSMAIVVVIALADTFGAQPVTGEALSACTTASEVLGLMGL